MRTKQGVDLNGFDWEVMKEAIDYADIFNIIHGFDHGCVITSALDGDHMHGSLHYVGRAMDLRTRHLKPHQRIAYSRFMSYMLRDDFDIVLENSHMHVEYDPKEKPHGIPDFAQIGEEDGFPNISK